MTRWTPEGEDAFNEGFKMGMDSADEPSGVLAILAGGLSGFLLGLLVAALVYWLA